MNLTDLFSVSAIVGGTATVLGWWLKTRIDTSIRHEYDKFLELFKAEQKRSDILHAERLEAFKLLSSKLLGLRRYCHANSAEYGERSEFEPRPDSLPKSERISLLQHHELLVRAMEERELFLSPDVREEFHKLFNKMGLGFNLELWLCSGNDPQELNAESLYNLIAEHVNIVMSALYKDLGFPEVVSPNKVLKSLTPLAGTD